MKFLAHVRKMLELKSGFFRWNDIVRDVEERLVSNRDFQMVEVENIKTTISHMRIPASEPVITMSSGMI